MQPPIPHTRPVGMDGDRVVVHAECVTGGIITATCRDSFVAVDPDNPAYPSW